MNFTHVLGESLLTVGNCVTLDAAPKGTHGGPALGLRGEGYESTAGGGGGSTWGAGWTIYKSEKAPIQRRRHGGGATGVSGADSSDDASQHHVATAEIGQLREARYRHWAGLNREARATRRAR